MAYSPICLHCGHAIEESFTFCPHCGQILHQKPLSTSVSKQILIYAVSFCFAPFGLRWVIPYLREKSLGSKAIGILALVLTLTSISLAIITFTRVAGYYSKVLDNATYKFPSD